MGGFHLILGTRCNGQSRCHESVEASSRVPNAFLKRSRELEAAARGEIAGRRPNDSPLLASPLRAISRPTDGQDDAMRQRCLADPLVPGHGHGSGHGGWHWVLLCAATVR